ncbi:MAG: glycine zipper domain-containing protein [Bdellovibrionales bacterium]
MVTRKTLSLASTLCAVSVLLAGCATTYTPVVDTKGIDAVKYQQDLGECRALSDQVDAAENGATDALIGAGVGAAAGAALGAISGNAGMGAATGATIGAFGGGGAGTMSSLDRKKNIMNNCLKGRGYKVLG